MKIKLYLTILITIIFSGLNAQPKFINYTNKTSVSCAEIINNNLWIGTNGGVLVRDLAGEIIESYTTADGLGNNVITSIARDSLGNTWFATINGLTKTDGTMWTIFDSLDGFALMDYWDRPAATN